MQMWYYLNVQKRRFLYNQMKKYYALYSTLRQKILSGEYPAHSRLPSKRTLADRSGCSLITVERACAMLEDEGYITAEERRGYYVCPIDAVAGTAQKRAPFDYLPEPEEYDKQDFEYSVWFRTVRKVISEKGDMLFVRSPNKGCAALRNAVADYLLRCRGMYAPPASIIIGSGAEQLYESVIKIFGTEKIYGIENPSYGRIRRVYTGMGAAVCPLTLGNDGIESEELKKQFDVLHVTPFHSYPTGISTSAAKRHEYLKWAAAKGAYIVEDDFDSEFFVPGHPIESLYSLGSESVIYINTFSKSISPAMRMGYMILPPALMARYDAVMGDYTCTVPVMEQYILAEFLNSGDFERHLNHMRRKLKKREE